MCTFRSLRFAVRMWCMFVRLCLRDLPVCQETDKYNDGDLELSSGYVYIAVVSNCSQIVRNMEDAPLSSLVSCGIMSLCATQWAMYCLIFFYHTLRDELKAHSPVPKLMCIKAVVFFTFWCVAPVVAHNCEK